LLIRILATKTLKNFHEFPPKSDKQKSPKNCREKTLGIDKRDTKLISGLLQEVRLQAAPSITQSLDGKKLKQRATPLSLSSTLMNHSHKQNDRSSIKEMAAPSTHPHI